ncbi:MAG: DNA recombination protein RmuC [Thiotrichaceae bacterium]|nr:DNA recombination protein RmuC [Thiotrichaceae bacterium]
MFILGFAIAWLLYAAPLVQSRKSYDELNSLYKSTLSQHEQRLESIEADKRQMQHIFSSLSQTALRENNAQFLQLAQETLLRFHSNAQLELEGRKQSIEEMIAPIERALDHTREQISEIEKQRQHSFGAVSEQLRNISGDHQQLRQETSKLVTALHRSGVRGQWGEMTLRRIVELSGMVSHCDFTEQTHKTDGEQAIRPDMIVKMPDNRELIIDAKTPLDAYLEASYAKSEKEKIRAYKHHAKMMRHHVTTLSAKAYWKQFDKAPDFVVLFVPGEQFLGAALEHDKTLLEYALNKNIILASPTSLIALLRAVAFGWKQIILSDNAEIIRDLGEELYNRVATFTDHMVRLGASLNSSVDHYNKTLGSLERSVFPAARRFTDLGIRGNKPMSDINFIDTVARKPENKR